MPLDCQGYSRAWRAAKFILLAVGLSSQTPAALHGQSAAPNNPTVAPQRSVRCPSPANPRKLYAECRSEPFDFIEETLTKDWSGLRGDLRRIGITPTASYTSQLLGNPSGGQSRGFAYSGTLQASVTWDFAKMLGTPGLSFNLTSAWSTGKNLSADRIGNSFTVANAYSAPGNGNNDVTLGEIYIQQQLFSNSLTLAAGRLAVANTFATMPVLNNYLNAGINAVPGALATNDYAFTSYPPGVEWGMTAIYSVSPQIQLVAGVFNTNPRSAGGGKGGLNFALQQGNRGPLAVAQVNYLVNHKAADRGLPGQYSVGGFYDGNKFSSLRDGDSAKSGTYSLYALFQQMVYRDGDADSPNGLTLWAESAVAPRARINTMPYFVGGGLSYQGLIPRRADDVASLGVIYGSFSR